MNFRSILCVHYDKEEISGWTSLKKSGYILLPLFVYLLVHDLAEVLFWAGINQVIVRENSSVADFLTGNAATIQGLVNGLMIMAGVAAVWPAVKSEIVWRKAAGISEKRAIDYVAIAALALSAAFGLNLLFHLLGITENSKAFTQAVNAQYSVDFYVGLFLYGVISPTAEEAVFRGIMYNRMKRCFGYYPALLLSALLFGAYHGNYVQAVYGMLLGLLIAYVYEKYESFAAPVLFHAAANIGVYVMTYSNSFRDVGTVSGIVVTIVLTGATAVCIYWIHRRNKKNKDGTML